MGRTRVAVAVAAAALACAGAAPAVHAATRATTQELTITASDGTKLACGLVLPGGSPPPGGWPGILLFPGLGQTHSFMETIASTFAAPVGFASLTCDTRGTGASGGSFDLDGPTEVQDVRDLFDWFAARPDVSDTKIGAFGLSLGGGAVWNAAVAGVPFAAIVPAISWTNLGSALNPNGVVKVAEVNTIAGGVSGGWSPGLAQARSDLLSGSVTPAVTAAEAARSSRSKLHSLTVPTLILEGRHDFLFDLDQAIAAYRLLAGPKRLYLGDLGHAPAKNPVAEQPKTIGGVIAWFVQYLVDGPRPESGVELGHDPWDGTTTSYKSLPATRHVFVNLPGTNKLDSNGIATRSTRLPGGPLETFGDGYLTVRYAGANLWGQLVATVSVKGRSTPVTFGAVKLSKPAGVIRIPLSDQAVLLPRGKRLVVTVGRTGAVYSTPQLPPPSARITIGRMTLDLSVLKKTVSR